MLSTSTRAIATTRYRTAAGVFTVASVRLESAPGHRAEHQGASGQVVFRSGVSRTSQGEVHVSGLPGSGYGARYEWSTSSGCSLSPRRTCRRTLGHSSDGSDSLLDHGTQRSRTFHPGAVGLCTSNQGCDRQWPGSRRSMDACRSVARLPQRCSSPVRPATSGYEDVSADPVAIVRRQTDRAARDIIRDAVT